MMKRKWILVFYFSVLTGHAFPQAYNFRNFNSEDGLAQSYVYSIVQDTHGYLWVGTGNGLSKFNGFVFQSFTTNDSLADNFTTCGISDGEQLWFGHMNGRLSYYDGKKFQSVGTPVPVLSSITHFAKSSDSLIWVSTYSDGIMKLGKKPSVMNHYKFKTNTIIISFEFIDKREILVGTNAGLLYCRFNESDEIEIIRSFSEIPESKITCISEMRNKTGFYIATENDGIFSLTKEDKTLKVSKLVADFNFDTSGIQYIFEDSKANIWLGSFGEGLIKMSYSTKGVLSKTDHFNNANGFATNNVKTVYEDREGIIWSGNYGDGLTQITPKTFFVYTFDKSLYGIDIFSIFFDKQYRWIGTEKGLLKMDLVTGKIIRFYSRGDGLPKDTVKAVFSTDGKEIWIGTEKNGLFRMGVKDEKIRRYPIANGILENSINSITGKGDQIWIGTKKGLCNINKETNKINWYTINKGGLPHNYINCLYFDRNSRLWITTRSNTLAYFENEKVVKVPLNYSSGTLILSPITEDLNSHIWVGSIGSGVFMIESDSVTNITVKDGLLSNYCYSLICDTNNTIWVGHKGGLSRIRATDFLVKPIQEIENLTDNYQFNQNAVIKDPLEKIWFGSDRALVSYDPARGNSKFMPPVPGITSFKINDEEKDYTGKIVLTPGKYKIRIEYLGISLQEPSLVSYQYRLEGFEQWSEITKNTSITYSNLSEGKYTFILCTSSGDGVVSENPLKISFLIKKPVWEKWWFYLVTVSFMIILVFIFNKNREYKFLAEKRILEEKVLVRTYEIQSQKNEIELQRDIINEKNASITASIRYASHIQSAILPPMELIDKLFNNNFVLSKPKDIVSGDFYWLAEKNDKIIFTVADCTGHGVPGAFMSFLGVTLLNSLVNIQGITKSDDIVNKLRERVIYSLQQSRKDITTSDGMDIALCVLDKKRRKIQFTGGMSNMVYVRNGKVEVLKADRFSVCVANDNPGPFTMKEFDVQEGDVFYLFSDGYKDQFGGDFDKKYLVPHFYLTLLELHKLPMSEQKEILEKKLDEWMKDTVQTDDITVLGIRL